MANELAPRGEPGNLQRWNDAGSAGYAEPPRLGGSFDGSTLFAFIRANYKLFFTIVALVIASGALLTSRMPKVYVSTATVLLDQRKPLVQPDLTDVVSGLPSDSSTIDTEVQVLNSAGMAYQVARTLNLIPQEDPRTLPPAEQGRINDVVQGIMRNRQAQRSGLTYMIDVNYRSTDPAAAQTMANAYAQSYINSQVDIRARANQRVREHLEQEIAKLRVQVKSADEAVARYKAEHGLTDTALGGTLTEQEISSYNQALTAARAQAAEDAQRLSAARAQLGRGSDAMGDASPALAQLRAQEATISGKIADLSSRYGPNHPELVTARGQLEDVGRLIRAQSGRTIASLEAQASASAGRANEISSRLSSTEGALQSASAAAVQLHELQTKLEAPQKLLEAYEARIAQLSTQEGAEQPDARIVSLASLPDRPAGPRWLLNMALATFLGLVLGLVVVLARHLFAVGVGSGSEVETIFGVDFLAALPRVKHKDDIALIDKVVDEPASPFSESLRNLAASVLLTGAAAPRVLAISSAFADEGKTTTTLALGRVIALRGRRVLIMDCDVQRPSFYSRFGLGGELGLVDVLQNRVALDDAIASDPRTPAHILVFGQGLQPGAALDESDLESMLGELRERYDVILLDLPPVLQVAETRVFAGLADTNVLLARWKRTSRSAIEGALGLLYRTNASVSGVALTQVPISGQHAVYGYTSYQSRLETAAA